MAEFARSGVQKLLQQVLEEEITELLGRKRTERRIEVDSEGYHNGYWLSLGDFDPARRGLLGEGAPLSEGSIVRLKAAWRSENGMWKGRPIEGLLAHIWIKNALEEAHPTVQAKTLNRWCFLIGSNDNLCYKKKYYHIAENPKTCTL